MNATLRVLKAIKEVRHTFGPPGEYGYNTPQGKALCELLDAQNALAGEQEAMTDLLAVLRTIAAELLFNGEEDPSA